MKTIIVTGGCGYIGSHVARAFKYADPDNRVHIIDRVKRDHTLKDMDGYLIEDFANEVSLSTIYDLAPDVIVHCAGTSLVGPSMNNPADYYENNVIKTLALLDLVKNMPKKPTIMFSSSASVYGTPTAEQLPLTEAEPRDPISPYGSTKAITEMMLKDYGTAYGINSICFRYFNAAGAMPVTADLGQEPEATHIVARVLEASIAGRAFIINGDNYDTPDGTCIRDYVHVWDIAIAHIKALELIERESYDNAGECHIFNLGTGKGISNKQIVDYVNEKYGLKFVKYGERRWGDPDELVADATDANRWLGWHPAHSTLEEIVDSAYKWYASK